MKKKIIVISIAIIVGFIMLVSSYNILTNKEIIASAKTEKRENNKILSVMLETSAHSGKYQESTSADWPDDGYVFNEKLSKCENGSTLTFNTENNSVTVHTSLTDRCYVYFDSKPDINIVVNRENNNLGTNANVTCGSATSNFNNKFQRIEISNINDYKISCNLNYTDITNKTYLSNKIIELAGTTQGTGQVINEKNTIPIMSKATTLSQSEYGTTSQFSATAVSDTSGTAVSNAFSFSGNEWVTNPSNMEQNVYYHLNITVPTTGYYQLCYDVKSGDDTGNGNVYLYDGATSTVGVNYVYSYHKKTCVYAGQFNAGTNLRIVTRYTYESGLTLGISLQKTSEVINVSEYRYEGKNPNNYVWFNNELWRIIGVFGEGTHGISNTNLVKIIRNSSIGSLVKSVEDLEEDYLPWSEAQLYVLLNTYYYNKEDGTNSGYCYKYYDVSSNCDYRAKGIQSSYRNMVKEVTWYFAGKSNSGVTSEKLYLGERIGTRLNGIPVEANNYIGLMYASDYGYASLADSCSRTTKLSAYSKEACAGSNWLFGQGIEWTMQSYNDLYVNYTGRLTNGDYSSGYAVRPTLYLNENVYFISGSGTSTDPYIIGM